MKKPTGENIFVLVLTIIFFCGLAFWLYVMFSLAGGDHSQDRFPQDCFTAAGDSC